MLTSDDPVTVSYAINATGVADTQGTYTVAPALGYTTSATGVLTGPTGTDVTGLSIAPGDTLWVRFKDVNVGSTDRFSRIDNVYIVIPEPATGGLLASGLGGLAMRRRRTRTA